jgi:DNA-binding transcriptional LysR family regulator
VDLDLLKDFLTVVEHGSILAAAEATGASQPTLSRKIRELEDSLGVLLLNRTSRGVSLTVYGETFKQHAEKLLRDHQRVRDELRSLKSGTHGHARIGLAPALSGYLPAVIEQLRKEKPGATFEVVEGTYDSLVDKTLRGEIDGAFTMLPPGESLESLAVARIGREPLVIVADANHPRAGGAGIKLQGLKDESWILMNRPRSIIDGFYQLASANGLEAPNVSIETSSLEFLKSMIRRSTLLSALPRGAVHAEMQEGAFKSLDVVALPVVETGFVHRHGVLAPLVTQVVNAVKIAVPPLSD